MAWTWTREDVAVVAQKGLKQRLGFIHLFVLFGDDSGNLVRLVIIWHVKVMLERRGDIDKKGYWDDSRFRGDFKYQWPLKTEKFPDVGLSNKLMCRVDHKSPSFVKVDELKV